MRTALRPAAIAIALVGALGLAGCIAMPPPPAPPGQSQPGSTGGSGTSPTIGPDGEVSLELAAEMYLRYLCPRNANIEEFNAARDAGDLDAAQRSARESLDIVQTALAAYANPDLVWPTEIDAEVDALIAGLDAEQVPLQAVLDAETVDEMQAADFDPSTAAYANSGPGYREAVGLDPDPYVACGL